MIKKVLKKIGLNDNEISIYLAGLKEGQVLANFLAKRTGISRQNTYDVLDKLIKKGLVFTTGEKYKTRFTMEDPARLEFLLDKQKKEIEKIKKDLELAMPEMESLYKTDSYIPRVKFYESKEGMKNLFLDSLQCDKLEILAVVTSIEIHDVVGRDFARYYIEQRVKRGICAKTIRLKNHEDYAEKFFHEHDEQLREIRYAPESVNFTSSFFIYDDKVFFISSKRENFGFSLASEEYRDVMMGLFNVLWMASISK